MTRNFKRQGESKLGPDFIHIARDIKAVFLLTKNLDMKIPAEKTNIVLSHLYELPRIGKFIEK